MNTIEIFGPWHKGFVLDIHTEQTGLNKKRSETGEALFLLKYRNDENQAEFLANKIVKFIEDNGYDKFIEFVIPMAASKNRDIQPVEQIVHLIAKKLEIPAFYGILSKVSDGVSLKDLNTKEEKQKHLENKFKILDQIEGDGPWNVLLIDDLYDSGATMEAACRALESYSKIESIYVIALTWTRR